MFIQAAGNSEPFFVEYYGEKHDQAIQCQKNLSAAELEKLLLKYLSGSPDWHSDYRWKVEPERPWWMFW